MVENKPVAHNFLLLSKLFLFLTPLFNGYFTQSYLNCVNFIEQEVEKIIKSFGWEFSWDQHHNLRYWYKNSAVINHPTTGEKIWFNQLTSAHASYFKAHPAYGKLSIPDDNFPFHSYYGDGSDIEPAVLQHIRGAMWSCAVGFRWRTSDVAIFDNLQVLHGRMGWTGDRKLVTSLADE